MPRKINLAEAFSRIDETYSPRIAGEVNDFQVKIVKVQGEFVWHHHDEEDELFLVVKGRLLMHFRDGDEWIEEGEMIVVPHGVEHCPDVPEGEAHVLLIERAGTPNTGSAGGDAPSSPYRSTIPSGSIGYPHGERSRSRSRRPQGRGHRGVAPDAPPHRARRVERGHRADAGHAPLRGDLGQAQRLAPRSGWARTTSAPAMVSADHHHGEAETGIYIVSGHPVFVFLEDGKERRVQTGPGDYIYVPPYVPHREENPSPDEEAVVVLARSTQEGIVVNLPSLRAEVPELDELIAQLAAEDGV